jgi:hypothetical protein
MAARVRYFHVDQVISPQADRHGESLALVGADQVTARPAPIATRAAPCPGDPSWRVIARCAGGGAGGLAGSAQPGGSSVSELAASLATQTCPSATTRASGEAKPKAGGTDQRNTRKMARTFGIDWRREGRAAFRAVLLGRVNGSQGLSWQQPGLAAREVAVLLMLAAGAWAVTLPAAGGGPFTLPIRSFLTYRRLVPESESAAR